jgi:hypothetical protein
MRLPTEFWLGCLVLILLLVLAWGLPHGVAWLLCALASMLEVMILARGFMRQRATSSTTSRHHTLPWVLRELNSLQRLLGQTDSQKQAHQRCTRIANMLGLYLRLQDKRHPLQKQSIPFKSFWDNVAKILQQENLHSIRMEPSNIHANVFIEPRILARALITWAEHTAKQARAPITLRAQQDQAKITITGQHSNTLSPTLGEVSAPHASIELKLARQILHQHRQAIAVKSHLN